jgi:hypothetical protein
MLSSEMGKAKIKRKDDREKAQLKKTYEHKSTLLVSTYISLS